MKRKIDPPVLPPDRTPAEALERMKEFTRRVIQVPKSEVMKRKRRKAH